MDRPVRASIPPLYIPPPAFYPLSFSRGGGKILFFLMVYQKQYFFYKKTYNVRIFFYICKKESMYNIQIEIKKVEDNLFHSVEVVVNNYYGIELRSRCQEATYIKARMMLIVISYGYGFTFQRIGEYLGYANHCQPRYFHRQYNNIKDIYPEYKIDLTSILSVLSDVLKD